MVVRVLGGEGSDTDEEGASSDWCDIAQLEKIKFEVLTYDRARLPFECALNSAMTIDDLKK